MCDSVESVECVVCDSGRGPGGYTWLPAHVLNVSSLHRLPQCGGSGTLRPPPLRKHHHGKCGDHPGKGERGGGEGRGRGVGEGSSEEGGKGEKEREGGGREGSSEEREGERERKGGKGKIIISNQ